MTGKVEIPLEQDSDKDRLTDYFEVFEFETDPFEADTDGDGLPDGLEVLLGYNPLNKDTDGNGVEDGDEDYDDDGLTNIREVNYGSDLTIQDTDGDGLWDGDEVNNHNTNPIKPDTDNDGLWDGEEGYDGTIYTKYEVYFDPLNPDTDGNGILDGDESFLQSVVRTVDTHDDTIIEISVQMKTNGNLEKNLNINSQMGIDMMSSDVVGLIGDPFDFKISTAFDSAIIKFTLDQSKLGNTQFSDLIALWYDEENQQFVECNTENGFQFTLDSGSSTLTVTTSHFSQYMIVDSKKWYQAWEDSFDRIIENGAGNSSSPEEYNYNTVFVIDTSGSMTDDPDGRWLGYDPVSVINDSKTCHRITACENFIDVMYPSDKAAIVTFSVSPIVQIGLTNSKVNLKSALQNINDVGGTHFSSAINAAVDLFSTADLTSDMTINRIIFLSDGVPEDAGDTQSAINAAVNKAYQNGIKIYTLGLGEGSGDDLLKDIAEMTGGEFYKVIEASDLTRTIGDVTLPNPNLGYLKDSDNDGIPDVIELYGLLPNGRRINTDPFNKDTDGDGIWDDEEMLFNLGAYKAFVRSANTALLNAWAEINGWFKFNSNPTDDDWDGDKLKDYEDPNPNSKINNGAFIDLASSDLMMLQSCLNYLGYSDVSSSDMGKNYGPVTRTAVYIYQMNHGFQTTSEQNGRMRGFNQIDDLTFATIVNDFANEYVNECGDINGTSNEIYSLLVGDISKKPYFSSVGKTPPTLLPEEEELGIKLVQKPNDFIKSNAGKSTNLYFYDYTDPLNQVMYKNMVRAAYESYLLSDTWDINAMTYFVFYEHVKSGGDWDYKLPISWENEFDNIPFMTIHFPFILRDDFCTPELYGNIHYGFVGTSLGFSTKILIDGSKFAAVIQDNIFGESEDWQYVEKGIKYFNDDISG